MAELPHGYGQGVAYTPSAGHIVASAHSYFIHHGYQILKGKSKLGSSLLGAAQPRGEMNIEPAVGLEPENEDNPSHGSIFWNRGERYSRSSTGQSSSGVLQIVGPPTGGLHPHLLPSQEGSGRTRLRNPQERIPYCLLPKQGSAVTNLPHTFRRTYATRVAERDITARCARRSRRPFQPLACQYNRNSLIMSLRTLAGTSLQQLTCL